MNIFDRRSTVVKEGEIGVFHLRMELSIMTINKSFHRDLTVLIFRDKKSP